MNEEKNMKNEYMKDKKLLGSPLIQLRQDAGGNTLHIQAWGEGEHNNREYGYADKFSVPHTVTDAVRNCDYTLFPSLASESVCYFRDMIAVTAYSDGVQMLIHAPSTDWNAPNGFILDLPAMRFGQLIEFLDANGLLHTSEGTRFVASSMGEEE